MKEFIISWILLAGLIVLFCVNSYTLKTISGDVYQDIEKLAVAINENDISEAEEAIKKIRKNWDESCKKLLHIFPNTQLGEIERLIVMIETHIDNEEFSEAVLRLKEMRFLVMSLEEHEKITLDNIF